MKTAAETSFRVLDANSFEIETELALRMVQMNNTNRIFVIDFDENIEFILPESIQDNKVIKIISHGHIPANVKVFPFGTTEDDITGGQTPLAIISGTAPTTLTFQFLNGVTYVTKSVGSSDTVETEVSFTFAQIRAMGTTPLELLVAPGAGKYNSIDSIIQEYKHVGVAYTAATASYVNLKLGSEVVAQPSIIQLTDSISSYCILFPTASVVQSGMSPALPIPLNTALTATTNDASDLTLGTGTLKFIISYKIRTVA